MTKAKAWLIGIFFLSLLLGISACHGAPSPTLVQSAISPTESAPTKIAPIETAGPTAPNVPAASLITASNVKYLKTVGQIAIQEPLRLVWVKDGQSFWVVSYDGATLFNRQTLQPIATFKSETTSMLLDVSPDGRSVATTSDNANIQIWDTHDKKLLRTMQSDTTIGSADFSADGSQLATISMDKWQVTLWDTNNGKKVMTLEGFETAAPVYDAQLGANGRTLIWHARGTVQLQDIASGKMGHTFSHEDFVSVFTLSADGKILATAAAGTVDGNFTPLIFLWNANNGSKLATLVNSDSFTSLSFSPDGKLLASASGNKVIIWEVGSHQKVAEFEAHEDSINNLAFSPDGKALLTSGADNLFKLWQTE